MKTKLIILLLLAGLARLTAQNPLTTNTGAPVGDNQNSQTVGSEGPVLLQDINLLDKIASFLEPVHHTTATHLAATTHTYFAGMSTT
jgi:catalase